MAEYPDSDCDSFCQEAQIALTRILNPELPLVEAYFAECLRAKCALQESGIENTEPYLCDSSRFS